MSESRNRIVEAFENELSGHPMHPSLRSQAVGRALQRDRSIERPRWRWAITLVAVALAMSIVATLLVAARELHSRQPVPVAPMSPALIYVEPPNNDWRAIDWSGTVRGPLGVSGVGTPFQSPDGSRILWEQNGNFQIINQQGHVFANWYGSTSAAWADDSSGLCVVDYASVSPGVYQVDFLPLSGPVKTITSFRTALQIDIAACSPSKGRVTIATYSEIKDRVSQVRKLSFGELLSIDFSTGVVANLPFPIGGPGAVTYHVASHDGTYVALLEASGTTVVDLSTGATVLVVQGLTPLAFSWDHSLLAGSLADNRGQLVHVPTGEVAWTDSQPSRVTQGALPNPRGSTVMFLTTTGGLYDLVVVGNDGRARVVATNVFVIAPLGSVHQ